MRLAIVIVSHNTRELLAACLRSVVDSLSLSPEIEAGVWVVDNASADGSAAMVADQFRHVQLLASSENLGFARANNVALSGLGWAARASEGEAGRLSPPAGTAPPSTARTPPDVVLLLNPDTEIVGDAIGHMVRYLTGHPDVGAVGAQLAYPDGSFQHGAFAFPGLLQLWFDFFPPRPRRLLDTRLNGRYPRRAYARGEPFPVGFALGAALMVRREAVAAVGLLDEGYFMYAEEVDWCWRMRRAGWLCMCVPVARIMHHAGASARQFREASTLSLWQSRKRLYERFYGPAKRWLAYRLVRMGMWAETRRARQAARRGLIGADERDCRAATYQQIARLYAERQPARD
jgi:N-acetylglucosaminyl-diphospho-decaprenol L-rhamnosyltransferase